MRAWPLLFLVACGPGYPRSDHFDGKRFRNAPPMEQPSFGDFLKWRRTREPGAWPDWIPSEPGPPPPERVNCDDLRVTFVNHATVLVQTGGVNLLTDPIYAKRVSPVRGIGPKRHRAPGIRFEDLPPIDVVVISHNHYDHLDMPTLKRLRKEHDPLFVVGLGTASLLHRRGVQRTVELDWWESTVLPTGVRVIGTPAAHWSLRGGGDRDRDLWMSYVLQTECGNTFFAGDTAMSTHFDAVGEAYGPFRLALLPIGAYAPRWFMHTSHIDPEQAAEARRQLRAHTAVAMHFGTFALADEGHGDAPAELRRHLHEDEDDRFWVMREGEGRDVPPVPPR